MKRSSRRNIPLCVIVDKLKASIENGEQIETLRTRFHIHQTPYIGRKCLVVLVGSIQIKAPNPLRIKISKEEASLILLGPERPFIKAHSCDPRTYTCRMGIDHQRICESAGLG